MHRRYEGVNIPIEAIRTFVVAAETGSFSKTGDKLCLSQPAISAQMKRLQLSLPRLENWHFRMRGGCWRKMIRSSPSAAMPRKLAFGWDFRKCMRSSFLGSTQ
ncbi:MAG: LysR family transcriptional regulator [Rhizobiales bacterium]|nr:LysR family transcriptional regulator [Hyphomicrobiales bacterium]